MKLMHTLFCLLLCALPALAEKQPASLHTPLNSSGIATWGNANHNRLKVPQPAFPRQDADFFKDFSFTKLDSQGEKLPGNSVSWSCVRDNVTGLVWEGKNSGSGLHGNTHTYTWYSSDATANGGGEGTEGETTDTTCGDPISIAAGCDTEKFVAAVNNAGWCGFTDWRIPTVDELGSIVNYGRSMPAISTAYFPDTIMPAGFWTSTTYAVNGKFAWIVIFDDGYIGSCIKSWAYYVRLVRGGQ